MNALEVLRTTLLDVTQVVGDEIPLIVGGGFGLYLRQEHLQQSKERTLFEQLSEPRATNARQIVSSCFGDPTDLGMLRLREHILFREDFPVSEFMGVLCEVFPE